MSTRGRVSLGMSERGDLSRGDVCLGGVYQGMSSPGGCLVSARHPHMDRMTDACKNIT